MVDCLRVHRLDDGYVINHAQGAGLRRGLTKALCKITPKTCETIISGFPERLRAIIKRKGERLTGQLTQAFRSDIVCDGSSRLVEN